MSVLYSVGSALLLLLLLQEARPDCAQPPADLATFARNVREAVRLEYSRPRRFRYVENGSDVDISNFGGVSVGPVQTFEVYPRAPGDSWKRLIAVDGKPLDPAELARRDAEHARDVRKQREREASETIGQRAARLKKEADEIRERDEILDDAYAVFEFSFVCRETFDGQSVVVADLKPRPNARVTTREGSWMKRFAGRVWVAEADHSIAKLSLHAMQDVTVGLGFVARIEPGSGFDYVRTKMFGVWLPSVLTVEGSGRTLLFRRFHVKTVTTYTQHQPYTPPAR
jgi:hypothetical protein